MSTTCSRGAGCLASSLYRPVSTFRVDSGDSGESVDFVDSGVFYIAQAIRSRSFYTTCNQALSALLRPMSDRSPVEADIPAAVVALRWCATLAAGSVAAPWRAAASGPTRPRPAGRPAW